MKAPAWFRPDWHRLVGWIPVGGLLIFGVWLMATEAGLQLAVRIAQRATGGELSIGAARGELAGAFELDDVRYELPSVTVSIRHAGLSLRLWPLLLGRVQAARLDVDSLLVATHDAPPEPGPREKISVFMPLALAVEQGRVTDFAIRIGEHAGVSQKDDRSPALAHGASGWRWQVPLTEFAAQWNGRWLVIARARAVTNEAGEVITRGRLAFADDLMLIEDFEVRGSGTAQVKGALALHDDASNDLAVHWRDARWIRADELTWLGSPRGAATLKGPWTNYAWTVQGVSDAFGVTGDARANGRGSLKAIDLAEVEIATLEGRVTGEGRVEWLPELKTSFSLAFTGLNPAARFEGWPGTLNGQLRFAAAFPRDATHMEFDGALADSTLRGYPLAVQATGRTEGGAVYLKSFAAQSGASRMNAQGPLLPQFGLRGQLASTDLRSLWAGLAGSGALSVSLRGTPEAPQLSVRGGIDDLSYQRYRAGHVDVDATLAPEGQSHVALDLADVRAYARLTGASLRADGTRLAHTVSMEARSADGHAHLVFDGGLQGGGWRGALSDAQVEPSRGDQWQIEAPAAIAYARSRLVVEPVCLNSAASRACARVTVAPGLLELASRTRNFELSHLKPWLPGDLSVTGALTGTARVRFVGGEVESIRADLSCTAGAVSAGGSTLAYGPGSVSIEPEGERLHATLRLTPAGGQLTGELWVAAGASLPDRPMLGDLTVHLPDLTWLPVLSPEIGAAQGSVEAQLQVSGTPRSPKLDGRLQVSGGRVQLVTPGIELTDITASFSRTKAAPLALHAEANSGGGRLVVDGALTQLQPEVLGKVTFKGQEVQGFNTNELRAWMSPDLTLALGQGVARLSGVLEVPRAEITPRELARGGVGPTSDQVIVEDAGATRARLVRVETQVKIALGDNVRFDGLGLKSRLTGAITAMDDPDSPTRGVGELRLDGGRYKAYGQDLTIETGRLIFGGGPVTAPAVDLTAFRKPRDDIKVGLRARGTLEAPEFSLFSEPAMSQEEQLAWLVLGRSLSGSLDTAQASQMSGAAVSLGLTGGEFLAQQLAPRLGLDEVSVGAKPGETADFARFTVGKYLSPKLFVSYGFGLFQPGHFFRMQYDIGRHFKLQGETGATQGGDVLYTIER